MTAVVPASAANPAGPVKALASPIPGIKALSIGGVGTGKTTLIKSLITAGITPCCIFTENSFDVLGDTDPRKLHWMYIKPTSQDLANLQESAKRVATMNADQIQKMHDMTRDKRNQYYPILNALANFKDDRTGQVLGNVGTWGTDKCLVLDSLSGLTIAATKLAVGEKYAMTQPEFQIAMKTIENLVIQICTGFHCHAYMTSHAEKELDEVNGGLRIFPSTLGRKLGPVLGRYFTDVFMTKRIAGPKWVIDTAEAQADLKSRNFAYGAELPMSFVPAVEAWKKRGGIISPSLPEPVVYVPFEGDAP
jgi:Ni2+-binding GTPase involved in maturation of urease and hydrogenase